MSSFQRNGSAESSRWRTNADEFRGYVRAKLEDLEQIQEDQWDEHRSTKKRISSLERRGQYQMGALGVIYAFIVIVISAYGAGLIHF